MNRDRGHKKWTSLMLPEHKERLQNWYVSQDYVNVPDLAEDYNDELDLHLAEALENQQQVTIDWVDNHRVNSLIGTLTRIDPVKGDIWILSKEQALRKIHFRNIRNICSYKE